MPSPARPRGAYGFALRGLPEAVGLLVDAPATWPVLEVRARTASGPAPAEHFGADSASLPLRTGGWVQFDRDPAIATFTLREALPEAAIVHPLLGVAVTVPAFWHGWESFHAGAFCAGDGAWAVIGEREAGKSSLIASLALAGVPIVCDDILVLSGTTALAGPRSADLRAPASAALGVGEPLGRVGDRDRWRLALAPVAPERPLCGWITLRWGEEIALTPVRGAQRLRRLAAHRAFLLRTPDPAGLIALSSLPVFEFTRPRRWEAAAAAAAALVAQLSAVRRA